MSTQSIRDLNISDISENLDKAISNIANSINTEDKMGIPFTISNKDLFLLTHYQGMIQDRLCVSDKLECKDLSNINKLIFKYI